jgi:hypothetical protein
MTKNICNDCPIIAQKCLLMGKVREEKLKFLHQRKMTREMDRLLYEYFDAFPFGSVEGFGQFLLKQKLVLCNAPSRPVPTRVKLTPGPSLSDVIDELRGK